MRGSLMFCPPPLAHRPRRNKTDVLLHGHRLGNIAPYMTTPNKVGEILRSRRIPHAPGSDKARLCLHIAFAGRTRCEAGSVD